MATTQSTQNQSLKKEETEELTGLSEELKELLDSLPKEKGWRTSHLYQYQGFWCQAKEVQGIFSAQKHFQAQNSDVIVASLPRSGTIWLKALVYAIANRNHFGVTANDHPLFSTRPHDLVPSLEYEVYGNNQVPDLSNLPSPRLFGTHMPHPLLPESVKGAGCRVVCLGRNPLDNFASHWHMQAKLRPEALGSLSLEEAFDMYCRGVVAFGPYLDHMLGYWNLSLDKPHQVLFLKYEDMKEDITISLKRLAEFLGFPFTSKEENDGVVQGISSLCSFKKLEEYGVNNANVKKIDVGPNTKISLLRKGEVGDWVNLLTPSMVDRMSKLMEEKLGGSGLAFKFNNNDKE